MVNKLTLDRKFRLREEAEMDAFLFAKQWIDDGKPELSPDSETEALTARDHAGVLSE